MRDRNEQNLLRDFPSFVILRLKEKEKRYSTGFVPSFSGFVSLTCVGIFSDSL